MKIRIRISALILVIIFSLGLPVQAVQADEAKDLQRLIEVFNILQSEHLSGTSSKNLVDSAINGMLWELEDPYTDYYTAEEWEQYTGGIEQSFAGVGIRIAGDEKGIYIDEVFLHTPAEESGLKRKDYIIEVAGQKVDDWTLDDVSSAIRGPEGTKVELTVQRGADVLRFEIERRTVTLPPVVSAWLGQGVGYLELSTFSLEAYTSFDRELSQLEKQGLKTLILDLRNNGGGYIHTAQQIAGRLLGKRTLLYEVNRYGAVNEVSTISSNAEPVDYSIVLLVNEFSASASELLAGALQDYGVAFVIGEQTYGKGSVQQIYSLSDGSVLKVTIEQYLTPHQREVDGIGIQPDRHVIGSVSQLITALKESGIKELRLEEDHHRLRINGVLFSEYLDYVVEDERIYVASRILGALTDNEVAWNGKEQSVEFGTGSARTTFKVSSPEVIQDRGKTYIELSAMKKVYPKLNWSWDGRDLTIQY